MRNAIILMEAKMKEETKRSLCMLPLYVTAKDNGCLIAFLEALRYAAANKLRNKTQDILREEEAFKKTRMVGDNYPVFKQEIIVTLEYLKRVSSLMTEDAKVRQTIANINQEVFQDFEIIDLRRAAEQTECKTMIQLWDRLDAEYIIYLQRSQLLKTPPKEVDGSDKSGAVFHTDRATLKRKVVSQEDKVKVTQLLSQVLCRFYTNTGTCRYGEKCDRVHVGGPLDNTGLKTKRNKQDDTEKKFTMSQVQELLKRGKEEQQGIPKVTLKANAEKVDEIDEARFQALLESLKGISK
jgi:hypothetical protein